MFACKDDQLHLLEHLPYLNNLYALDRACGGAELQGCDLKKISEAHAGRSGTHPWTIHRRSSPKTQRAMASS